MSKNFSEKDIDKSLKGLKEAMESGQRFIFLVRGDECDITTTGGMTSMEIIGTLEHFKHGILNNDYPIQRTNRDSEGASKDKCASAVPEELRKGLREAIEKLLND